MKSLVALLMLATPAMADETWMTAQGQAVYVADIDYTAILSVPQDGGVVHLYFDGLAGNSTDRYVFNGYWIGKGAGLCSAALTGPDGRSSTNWGLARIAFDAPAFPTGWTVTMGNCGYDADWSLRADLE